VPARPGRRPVDGALSIVRTLGRRRPRVALGARLRAVPRPLALLLVVAVVEMLAWNVATPLMQGPDESAHASYVQYLAETGHKPGFDGGTGTLSTEFGNGLYAFNLYALVGERDGKPFWNRVVERDWEQVDKQFGHSARSNGSGPNAVAKNPPLYYGYEAIPYKLASHASFFNRVFWMRIANGLLFIAAVVCAWLLAAELFATSLARTMTAASVALLPTAAFMSGVINPDTALFAVSTAWLLAAVRLVVRGPTTRRVVGVVALCVAGLLVHGRGLPLAPSTAIALGLAWWRHRPPVRRALVWVGGGAAVVIGGYVLYRLVLNRSGGGAVYGGEVSFHHGKFSLGQFLGFVWQFYLPKLPFMAPRLGPDYGYRQMFIERYLAGSFGSLEVQFSANVYRLVEFLSDLGLVALVGSLVVRRRALKPRWDVLLLLASFTVITLLFLHLASYRALVGGGVDPLIVGRYLLPLTAVMGLAIAFVVESIPRRAGPYLAAAVLSAALLLDLGALGLSLARFYG
jgi:Predicted membrane protein (DUF2142)